MQARLFAALLASAVAVACSGGSNSIEVTAPTSVKCQVSVTNGMSGAAPAEGTSNSISVDTNRDCTWTASTASDWIALVPPTTGQGSGAVGYRVTANPQATQRRGAVEVNNSQVEVVQDPAPCRFTVTPASTTVPAAGAVLTETVETVSGCSWTSSSLVNWIAVTGKPGGSQSGTVTLAVAVNAGPARSAAITIAGQTITIHQSAVSGSEPPTPPPPPAPPGCSFAVGSASETVGSDAATINVTVTAAAGCGWTATSQASWITVASGSPGSGDGTVTLRVAANTGDRRTGTVTIADRTLTVTQSAAPPSCSWSIAPASQSVPDAGASGSITVTASATSCAWTAVSNAAWITITDGAAGTGNGVVTFIVAANTEAARTATLTVAGQTFTVTQAAAPPPCAFTLSAPGATVPAEGGTGTVGITASASTCAWTATNTADWIVVADPGSGTGSGSIAYTVAANAGAARTTTLTIAGQPFTISQAAAAPVP